ncbi:hypothetical protein [Candidatus Marimicrobium litorale]|uniref:Uncharacterized protein n=1 Tax=Candidatus Marimicrobium litorale TaxID=2518991 RepID=A0ABT3T981_9GAMM|nr:hypothetical protein [Candidatus Marimicrobium litorale]MCX2978843.1 hypothetical protein [Candidatus Marimicrobium litorale]
MAFFIGVPVKGLFDREYHLINGAGKARFFRTYTNVIRHRCLVIEAHICCLVRRKDQQLSSANSAGGHLHVRAFGQKPRRQPGPVLEVILRLWISSIYGENWVTKRASTLYRKADSANHTTSAKEFDL